LAAPAHWSYHLGIRSGLTGQSPKPSGEDQLNLQVWIADNPSKTDHQPKDFPMSDTPRIDVSRRGFLKGAGLTAATTVLDTASALARDAHEAAQSHPVAGPDAVPVKLHVNGQEHAVSVEPRYTLAETLRDHLNLTGTKVVCDRGSCSACTVWIDGSPALACMTLAIDAVGRKITTIEGLSQGEHLHPLQAAFVKHDAMQCGFCTPGMVMSCAALLGRNPNPTLADVKHAVSGNLCRCGTYPKVFAATLEVAQDKQAASLLKLQPAQEAQHGA
jgi:aerobic-type carbon monoxide dehydrogenase small subunit (CoxS/CutS family)